MISLNIRPYFVVSAKLQLLKTKFKKNVKLIKLEMVWKSWQPEANWLFFYFMKRLIKSLKRLIKSYIESKALINLLLWRLSIFIIFLIFLIHFWIIFDLLLIPLNGTLNLVDFAIFKCWVLIWNMDFFRPLCFNMFPLWTNILPFRAISNCFIILLK